MRAIRRLFGAIKEARLACRANPRFSEPRSWRVGNGQEDGTDTVYSPRLRDHLHLAMPGCQFVASIAPCRWTSPPDDGQAPYVATDRRSVIGLQIDPGAVIGDGGSRDAGVQEEPRREKLRGRGQVGGDLLFEHRTGNFIDHPHPDG